MDLIKKYFPKLSNLQLSQYEALMPLYSDWNQKINVISRKDIDNLYLHHILHSLALVHVINFPPGTRILDLGAGGGFPSIPLAIYYPQVFIDALDSTRKKLSVIDDIAANIQLKNINTIHKRVEEHKTKYHFIVSRAVAEFSTLLHWSRPLISTQQIAGLPNGLFCYKGKDISAEIKSKSKNNIETFPIQEFFLEDYFTEKCIYYIPIS